VLGKDPVIAEGYASKVKDRFGDLVGLLVIAKAMPGRKEFQDLHGITGREMEVVDLIFSSSPNKTIGEVLGISERTVESHCLHIYNKLGIKNKSELIKLYSKYEILT
jgi:DNA-binding CsgD family transcriptional regulator